MLDHLSAWLSEQRGVATHIAALNRIATGNSRAMWRLETTDGERYVARVEQGGVFATSSAEEFRVMGALATRGVPVAPVRWSEPTGVVLGRPFFVMDFVDSVAPGADERTLDDRSARALVATLARLHAVDPTGLGFDLSPAAADATHAQIDRWHAVARSSSRWPNPLVDEAAAWLHHFAPPLSVLAAVHGDAGPGNVLFGADGSVVALTDFEFAHLGDPREDWVYCAAMRGSRTMSRTAWADLFASGAGVLLDPADWHYWEAFNLFKGACANLTCAALFTDGTNRAPNMLAIGTALHQSFLRRLVDLTDRPPGEPS